MKIFTYIAVAIALGLIGFNLFQIDYSHPFEGNSTIAIIGVVAGICAILLLLNNFNLCLESKLDPKIPIIKLCLVLKND